MSFLGGRVRRGLRGAGACWLDIGVIVAAVVVLSVLGGTAAVARAGNHAPGARLPRVMTGADLARMLAHGRPVDAHGVLITGDVNLTSLTDVAAALRCSGCVLRGAFKADDVEFHGVLDLARSRIIGRVQARGARFDRSVGFIGANFAGPVSFDGAVFQERAALDGAVFDGAVSFAGARFMTVSTFAGASFAGPAGFSGAVFAGVADFSGEPAPPGRAMTHHCGDAARRWPGSAVRFAGTVFQDRADFYNRCFAASADFSGAVLGGAADFGSAEFTGNAVFENASFGGNATFVVTSFDATADFTSVLTDRDLSFNFDTFGGTAELDDAVVRGRLSLRDLTREPDLLSMHHIVARGGIVMEPGQVEGVVQGTATQLKVLRIIEDTARADGNSVTANNARYIRLTLAGRARSGSVWASVQDGFFYRRVAGYLVRPLNPLAFLGLVLAAGFVSRFLLRRPAPLMRVRERLRVACRAAAPAGKYALAPGPLATAPGPAGAGGPGRAQPSPRQQPRAADTMPAARGGSRTSAAARGPAAPAARASLLVQAFEALRDALVAALKLLPSKEARKAAKAPQRARDVARSVAYTAEYLTSKLLMLLFLICIANSNQTLHQLIDTTIGIR